MSINRQKFLNCRIRILADEFVNKNQFLEKDEWATIINIDHNTKQFLLRLDESIVIQGKLYKYAIAGTRLENQYLEMLFENVYLGCSVTLVPDSQFDIEKPFDLSWWRGGASAITSITLKDK